MTEKEIDSLTDHELSLCESVRVGVDNSYYSFYTFSNKAIRFPYLLSERKKFEVKICGR